MDFVRPGFFRFSIVVPGPMGLVSSVSVGRDDLFWPIGSINFPKN